MKCRTCGKPVPGPEVGLYAGRCEDCWTDPYTGPAAYYSSPPVPRGYDGKPTLTRHYVRRKGRLPA